MRLAVTRECNGQMLRALLALLPCTDAIPRVGDRVPAGGRHRHPDNLHASIDDDGGDDERNWPTMITTRNSAANGERRF
jgi:hypothetical protein